MVRCCVCDDAEGRYRCPNTQCRRWTCSVSCVKSHKVQFECSGVRNRAEFVAINEFSDQHLLSDYHFLESGAQLADSAARNPNVRTVDLPRRRKTLRNKCKRRKIDLLLLPKGMTRHDQNRSTYNQKTKLVLWTIEMTFVAYGEQEHDVTVCDKFNEEQTWSEVINRFLSPSLGNAHNVHLLRAYTKVPLADLRVVRKIEKVAGVCYYEHSANDTICESLRNTTVIEFPRVCVVHSGELQSLSIKPLPVNPEDVTITEDGANNQVATSKIVI